MKAILKNFLGSVVLLFLLLAFSSCRKEGTGGKSGIKGYVKHHNNIIPNSVVYIKYGATEFPGADATLYDASATADANGFYQFSDLRKGDYYLYGLGYDAAISETVRGGLAVKLKYNKTTEVNLPVTE